MLEHQIKMTSFYLWNIVYGEVEGTKTENILYYKKINITSK